jgi:hypothetical protein
MFDWQLLNGTMESWPLSYLGDTQTLCLDASNRYFMPSKDAPGERNTPFHNDVDPHRILTNMMSRSTGLTFIHAGDNQVQYYKSRKDTDGGRRYGSRAHRLVFLWASH